MKVALTDNMNNAFFSICRYLRDEGVDAHLYVMPDMLPHFRPQSDTFEDVDKLTYVHTFPVNAKGPQFVFSRKQALAGIEDCDLIMSCGYSLGFLRRHGITADVFVAYGSDIYAMPFMRFSLRRPYASLGESLLAFFQRRAIAETRVIISDRRYSLFDGALRRLNRECLNCGSPFLYVDRHVMSHHEPRWEFLREHDFVLFNHGRQLWKTDVCGLDDFEQYGANNRNDRVLRAFAAFLEVTAFRRPVMVAFEYGPDVEASKALAHELRISKALRWMPTMERRDIMVGLSRASIATGYFRENMCGIGGVSSEALACGVPFVTYTNGALDDPRHQVYGAPIVDALREADIVRVLVDFERNKQKYVTIGQKGREWFEKSAGRGLAAKYALMLRRLHEDPTLTQESDAISSIFASEPAPACPQ